MFFVGCSGYQFKVDSVEPVERHLSTQVLDLKNCDSRTELQKSLATEFKVAEHITINNGETVNEHIENQLPGNINNRFENQIKTVYKEIYEVAMSDLDQTILTVPANKVFTFNINWEEKVYDSKIHLVLNEKTYTWSFTYSLEIPISGNSWEIGCTA